MSKTTNKFSPEVRNRAIRMVLDHEAEHPSRWAAVSSIAAKIGCSPATLHEWVKKTEVDSGKRAGLPSDDLVHRRTPWRVRGRADLQPTADCPINLLRERRQATGRGSPVDPCPQRYQPEDRDTSCLRAEFPRLWRSQGLAAIEA